MAWISEKKGQSVAYKNLSEEVIIVLDINESANKNLVKLLLPKLS